MTAKKTPGGDQTGPGAKFKYSMENTKLLDTVGQHSTLQLRRRAAQLENEIDRLKRGSSEYWATLSELARIREVEYRRAER